MKLVWKRLGIFLLIAGLSVYTVHAQDDVEDAVNDALDNAEGMLEHHGDFIKMQMEHVQEQMEHVQEQMERVREQTENMDHHVGINMEHLKMAMSKLKDIDIDIDIPEINIDIPDIDIDIPDVPDVKAMRKDFDGETERKVFDQTYDIDSQKSLEIQSKFSSVQVFPTEDDGRMQVHCEMIGGAKTKEKAREMLERIKLKVSEFNDRFEITIELGEEPEDKENNKNTMLFSDLQVGIPAALALEIENSFGEVRLRDLSNSIECKNSFGGTHVENTKGNLDIKTSHGGLRIQNHSGGGTAVTEFGNINIDGWKGDLKLVSGFGNAKVSGLSDDVILDGKVSFGKASIVLPEDFSGEIRASSEFGKVKAPKSLKMDKDKMNSKVSGKIGQGRGRVHIVGNFSPIDIELEN